VANVTTFIYFSQFELNKYTSIIELMVICLVNLEEF